MTASRFGTLCEMVWEDLEELFTGEQLDDLQWEPTIDLGRKVIHGRGGANLCTTVNRRVEWAANALGFEWATLQLREPRCMKCNKGSARSIAARECALLRKSLLHHAAVLVDDFYVDFAAVQLYPWLRHAKWIDVTTEDQPHDVPLIRPIREVRAWWRSIGAEEGRRF